MKWGVLMDGISALIIRDTREMISFSTQPEVASANQEEALTRNQMSQHLDLEFPSLQN
jgi:hypothetical protein